MLLDTGRRSPERFAIVGDVIGDGALLSRWADDDVWSPAIVGAIVGDVWSPAALEPCYLGGRTMPVGLQSQRWLQLACMGP